MKYELHIDIDRPLEEVIIKMDDPENMQHWQRGFVSFTPLQGTPGETGATAKLVYKMGKRRVEMIETIAEKNLPFHFHATFKADGVFNKQENFFEATETGTRWTSRTHFKFSGPMMKLMAFLMPGAFKKQSFTYMRDFKNFVENGVSVRS